jgi:hypothetical protein|tara:strand:+ start:492 stop:701 length:210 start_codon:yes stop_codon:yes gene_type:complete
MNAKNVFILHIKTMKPKTINNKREIPTVKEMETLRKACPSITDLDKKIDREKEKKSKNIESIFIKKKKK